MVERASIKAHSRRQMHEKARGLGGIGRERQAEIYLGGVRGRKPAVPVAAGLLEERARKAMSRTGFAYVAGGAGLENTIDANRAAFDRWRIVPRVLHDVAERQCGIELLRLQTRHVGIRPQFERGANDVGSAACGHYLFVCRDKCWTHDAALLETPAAAVALFEIADE